MFFLLIILSFLNTINTSNENYLNAKISPSIFNLDEFNKIEEFKNKLNLDDISAQNVFVKELRGKILYQKNPDEKRPIASLTKLLSAYISTFLFNKNDIFVFDKESVDQEGNAGNFYVGEKVDFDSLLKASLIASSNDSMYLIAKTYGLKNFVDLMNRKVKEWGLINTNFEDTTGISSLNQSTARELSIMMEKIFSQNPEIFYISTQEKVIINGKILWNTNILLYKYKKFIVGSKTGFTSEAGECLAMILKFENSPYISVIILNSKDRWSDAEKIIKELAKYYGS